MTPRRWVLASGNRGKASEIQALLHEMRLPIELVPQSQLGVDPAAETASTFLENALIKARHAALATGLPAIAEDSGLTVDALGGAPGVRSARYAGDQASDAENVAKLLASLENVEPHRRGAAFHCVVVAVLGPDDPAPAVAAGRWKGRIAGRPSGAQGFGYDPVFFDPVLDKTAAELSVGEKGRVSHRGHALRALVTTLAAGELIVGNYAHPMAVGSKQ